MASNPFNDDTRLVEACIAGDPEAWTGFMKRYSHLIFISIHNRLKKYGFDLSNQDIEDIRQLTLASLWKNKKLEQVKNRRNISYWLSIVSGNMAIEYVRKRPNIEPLKSRPISEAIDEEEMTRRSASSQANPRDEFFAKELSEGINRSIESMPARERLVIRLNLIHNKKHEEIADMLNMPEGTVSGYIRKAKERLRKELKDFF